MKGLRVPVGVDQSGGCALVEGEENDRKAIWLALSDCENNHAFQQDLGVGTEMVFAINDAGTQAVILQKLIEIFARFERQDRYRLVQNSVRWSQVEGELILEFKYRNLETDEESPFKRTYTSEGA